MKTRFYFPMIISLLVISVSLLTACGDSDNPLSDTTKPVIDLKSPAEGGVLAIGSEHGVHFEMDLSDDVMLKSYKIEIHNNFDHHSHDTRTAETTVDFTFNKSYDVSEQRTAHIHHHDIVIPAKHSGRLPPDGLLYGCCRKRGACRTQYRVECDGRR